MSSWTAASSDCSRPVNNYVHVKTADLYRPNARLTPERQGYQVLTPFGKLGYSLFFCASLALLFSAYKVIASRKQQLPLRVSLVAVAASIAAFCLFAGGDTMESGRFLVPAFAFSILALILNLEAKDRTKAIAAVAVVSFLEIGYTAAQPYGGIPAFSRYLHATSIYRPSIWDQFSRIHAGDTRFTDMFIQEMEASPKATVTVASIQAGFVMYYVLQNTSKKIRFIDLKGLSTGLSGFPNDI